MNVFGSARRNREQGAVAVVTALVVFFVAIGVAAVTIDVGRITYERRQLQNGADASAVALAKYCAEGDAECSADSATHQLETLAGLNAQDGRTDLSGGDYDATSPWEEVCFHGTTNIPLPGVSCPTGTNTDLSECPPAPPWLTPDFPWVETRPRTLEDSESTLLPYVFAKALAGAPPGGTFQTCARAAWGQPKSYTGTVPVTFSECEWDRFMDSTGNVYPYGPEGTKPGYGGANQPAWPPAVYDRVIYLQTSDKVAPCTYSNGKDGPGGFGDVEAPGCQALVSTGGWLIGDNGKNVENDCKDVLSGLRGTVVSVPVFNCLFIDNSPYTGKWQDAGSCDGSGSGGTYNYHVAGWAKFYISGYVFPGKNGVFRMPSYISATNTKSGYPCLSSEACISGWFLKGELEASAITAPGGPNDYGTYAVVPAG